MEAVAVALLPADGAVNGKWDSTFTRVCNVEAQERNAEALGQCRIDRVQTHFVGIDAAGVNQHRSACILACH